MIRISNTNIKNNLLVVGLFFTLFVSGLYANNNHVMTAVYDYEQRISGKDSMRVIYIDKFIVDDMVVSYRFINDYNESYPRDFFNQTAVGISYAVINDRLYYWRVDDKSNVSEGALDTLAQYGVVNSEDVLAFTICEDWMECPTYFMSIRYPSLFVFKQSSTRPKRNPRSRLWWRRHERRYSRTSRR